MRFPVVASSDSHIFSAAPKRKNTRNKPLTFLFAVLKAPFKVMSALCFWKKRKVKLLPEQKAKIDTILTDPAYLTTKQVRPHVADGTPGPDIAVEKLHTFLEGFCTNLADCLFDEKLKKPIETVMAGADSYEKSIQSILTFLIDTADNVITTLTQSANLSDDIKKITNTKNIDEIFTWLCKDQAGKNLRQEIETELASKVKELATQHNIELPKSNNWLKDYEGNILDWIFQKEHGLTTLLDSQAKKDKAVFNVVVKAAVQLLLEKKIEYFKGKFKIVFKEKLDQIVRELLKNSAQKLSTIVSDRLTTQIQKTNLTDVFDQNLKILSDHIEGYISAEKRVDALLEKAEKLSSIKASTQRQIEARSHLVSIAEAIKTDGKEVVKKKLMIAAFAEENACNDYVKQMTIVPDEAHRDNTARSAEELFHAHLSELFMQLVLPLPIYDKDGTKKSGLEQVWDILLSSDNLPKEINALIDEMESTFNQLIPESQKEQLEKIKEWGLSSIKTLALAGLETKIKQRVHQTTYAIIDRLSNTGSLEELLAYTFLPTISNALITSISRQAMFSKNNLGKVAALYHKAAKSGDPAVVKKEISQLLLATTKKTFHSFNAQEIEGGDEGYYKLISPMIDEMEAMLKITMSPNSSPGEIASLLQEYNKGVSADKNPTYETLLMNACFGLGSVKLFGGKKFSKALLNTFKGSVGQLLSNATYPYHHSHVKPLHTALTAVEEKYGTKEQVKELLFGDPKPISKEDREAKLKKEINQVARLAHDIIRQGVKSNAGYPFLMFVPSTKSCESFLSTVIQKTFLTNPSINKSLLFKVHTTALNGLLGTPTPTKP